VALLRDQVVRNLDLGFDLLALNFALILMMLLVILVLGGRRLHHLQFARPIHHV